MFSRKNDSSRHSELPLFKDLAPGTWDRLPPYTIGTDSLGSVAKISVVNKRSYSRRNYAANPVNCSNMV